MKHKIHRIKKLTALMLSCILIFTMIPLLSGCSAPARTNRTSPAADNIGFQNDVSDIEIVSSKLTESDAEPGSWAIYWYLCGSDLESEYACATSDLLEMLEVQLPENVELVIQTGGVHEDHRTHTDELKGLVHRVGGGACHRRDQGDLLAGEGIDEGGFAGVPVAEESNVEAVASGGRLVGHRRHLHHSAR